MGIGSVNDSKLSTLAAEARASDSAKGSGKVAISAPAVTKGMTDNLPEYAKQPLSRWDDIWKDTKIHIPSPQDIDNIAKTGDILKGDGTSIFNIVRNVMMALYKVNSTLKRMERQDRTDLIRDVADLQMKEADKIREAAGFNLAAGIVGGAFQVAGGAMALGAAVMTPKAEPMAPEPEIAPEEEAAPTVTPEEEGGPAGGRPGEMENESLFPKEFSGEEVRSKSMEDIEEGGAGAKGAAADTEATPSGDSIEMQEKAARNVKEDDAARTETDAQTQLDEAKGETLDKQIELEKAKADSITKELQAFKQRSSDNKAFVKGQKYQMLSLRVQALTQLMGGAGQAVSSALQYGGQQVSAQQKELEAKTDMYKAYQSDVDGFIRDASDAMSGMLSKLDGMQQAIDDTTLKIVER